MDPYDMCLRAERRKLCGRVHGFKFHSVERILEDFSLSGRRVMAASI